MRAVQDLPGQYTARFGERADYRTAVWEILVDEFFAAMIPSDGAVLDLGCGWGEFINNVDAVDRYGMDLNPDSAGRLDPQVQFLRQDCAEPWRLPDESLDRVFTSNFLEHLPDKQRVSDTLEQAWRCLRPGGRIICLGPNVRCLGGSYWDFFDHYVPLTERSLGEALTLRGFEVEQAVDRFLPYTMSEGPMLSLTLLRAYLKMPSVWRLFGKQFLVVARK